MLLLLDACLCALELCAALLKWAASAAWHVERKGKRKTDPATGYRGGWEEGYLVTKLLVLWDFLEM
jgi:hypothetical protein